MVGGQANVNDIELDMNSAFLSNSLMDMEGVMVADGVMEIPWTMVTAEFIVTPEGAVEKVFWEIPGVFVVEGLIWTYPILPGPPLPIPPGFIPLHPTGVEKVFETDPFTPGPAPPPSTSPPYSPGPPPPLPTSPPPPLPRSVMITE